jgi:tetratricopeptide (TPR) repeat protein
LKSLSEEGDSHPQKIHHALALKEGKLLKPGVRILSESLMKEGRFHEALGMIDRALPILSDPSEKSRLLRIKINLQNSLRHYEEALLTLDEFALAADDEPSL